MRSRWSMAIRQWLVHATFYKLDINWTVNWTDKRWMQELDDQPLQDLSRTEVVFAKAFGQTHSNLKNAWGAPAAATRASSGKVPDHRDWVAPNLPRFVLQNWAHLFWLQLKSEMLQMDTNGTDGTCLIGRSSSGRRRLSTWLVETAWDTMACVSWWSFIR